jgi:SAM-dependent methyltransferase
VNEEDHMTEPAPAKGNRIRGPLNAAGLRALDGVFDRTLGRQKRRLFADLPDDVVELGSGVGANLRYLRPGTRLTAVEPNPAMHEPLRRAAANAGVDLTLLPSSAEAIPLPNASTDVVICTLVLCTVPNPDAVLGEVRRIMRPGGRFLFVEHVAADPASHRVLSTSQRLLHRPWHWLFEGCDLRRDTGERIRSAGFASVELHSGTASPAVTPVAPMVWGTAVA